MYAALNRSATAPPTPVRSKTSSDSPLSWTVVMNLATSSTTASYDVPSSKRTMWRT